MQITLFLPKGIDFNLIKRQLIVLGYTKLKPKINDVKAFFHYLITSLSTLTFRKRKEKLNDKWVPIHSETIRYLLGRKYSSILKMLERIGYLKSRKYYRNNIEYDFYISGVLPKQFKIPRYKGYQYEVSTDETIINKLKNVRLKNVNKNTNYKRVAEHIENLRLENTDESRTYMLDWFKNNHPKYLKKNTVEDYIMNFSNSNSYIDGYGFRLHSRLSYGLPSKFRQFLTIEGDDSPLVGLDITNSQPWVYACLTPELIGSLVPECKDAIPIIQKYEGNHDYQTYQKLCAEGTIYEFLATQFKVKYNLSIDRSDAKIAVFSGFYSDYEKNELKLLKRKLDPSKIKIKTKKGKHSAEFKLLAYKLFKETFPSLWNAFKEIKELDWRSINKSKSHAYSNNCLLANRIESALMYSSNGIISELNKSGITFISSIHDSVIIKSSEVDLAEKCMILAIEKNFKLLTPQIKRENY